MKELKASEPLLLDGALTPDAILKDPTLSAGARLFWVMLAEYQGKGVECFPFQDMLAGFLGVKVRQFQSYVKELENYRRGDPPEVFPLIEVKRVWIGKEGKTKSIYTLLSQPFVPANLKANGAESHQANGGDAQYSAHRSEGEAQDAAAAPPAMPSEDGGAVANGMPPSDAQSFAHPGDDAQEMLGKDGGLAPHGMPPGDTQSSAHRSGSDTRDSWTAPPATPGKDGGMTPDGMRDTQSSAHQSESRLMVEYAKFREAEALRLFDALPALVLRGFNDKKQNLLRQEGRLDRMALDVRRREMKNLILLDIEREQVMPFAEWVEPKRKCGTST